MLKPLLDELQTDEYIDAARKIYDILKPQLQTPKGLIRLVRDKTDIPRKEKLETLLSNFCHANQNEVADLDEKLNVFCNDMLSINESAYESLTFTYLEAIARLPNIKEDFPDFFYVYQVLIDETNHPILVRWRLQAIIGLIVASSLGQSNKALAGQAGEILVKACLGSAGMREFRDYRYQWKAGTGSDTDFVIPYVSHMDMSRIDVFIAAQFSSNDRARMASSELHSGGERYLVTGNGMDASTKSMRDIGLDIINDYKRDNTKIVCRDSHMKVVVDELVNIGGSGDDQQAKISFFQGYHVSFAEFADRMKRKLISQ